MCLEPELQWWRTNKTYKLKKKILEEKVVSDLHWQIKIEMKSEMKWNESFVALRILHYMVISIFEKNACSAQWREISKILIYGGDRATAQFKSRIWEKSLKNFKLNAVYLKRRRLKPYFNSNKFFVPRLMSG